MADPGAETASTVPPTRNEERSPFARLGVRGLVLQTLIAVAAVLLIAHRVDQSLRRDENASISMLLAYGTMLLLLLVRGRLAKLSWRRLYGSAPRPGNLPLLGVVVPLALLTAATLILFFVPLSYLAPELVQHAILDDSPIEQIRTVTQFWMLFVNIAIAAPVVEELFFRGFVLHRFAHKWGTGAGVLGSSALFAVGHVEWIGHFVTGLIFALIYLRTRSLWMSVLAHAVYNGIFAVSIGYSFFTHQPDETQTIAQFQDTLGGGVLALAAGMFLMWLYFDLYWKDAPVRAVIDGPVPYDQATTELSTSAS